MQRSTHRAALAALAGLGLAVLAGGCTGGDGADEDAEAAAEAAEAAEAGPAETVFDDLVETQERARGVEDYNDQRRALLESAIEPPEAGDAADDPAAGEEAR